MAVFSLSPSQPVKCLIKENCSLSEYTNDNLDDILDNSISIESEITPNLDSVSTSLSKPEALRRWALENQITQTALSSLLKDLRVWLPFEHFPKDARTLLGTPQRLDIKEITGGRLYHFGITKYILQYLENGGTSQSSYLNVLSTTPNLITVTIGIDGLPISKSSNVQFWPILAYLNDLSEHIFVVSLYCGNSKPHDVSEYLNPFVEEMKHLEEEGVFYQNQNFTIRIRCIIADAPARSYIKCIKNHNGYYGCERCHRKGKWRRKVTYSGFKQVELYTDEHFVKQTYVEHHEGISPLVNLKVGLVTQIPLDYMHLCCLGVMKKLLLMWKEIMPFKIKPKLVSKLSKRLKCFAKYVPNNFNRKSRSLDDLRHWKATEFRLFLLYLGPLALRGILTDKLYNHFILFHAGVYILTSSCDKEWVIYAGSLLERFSNEFGSIYSKDSCVYNVHMLSHLHTDALVHGKLDSISAFPFENFMQTLKRLIKSHSNFLAQVANRILERDGNLFRTETVQIKKIAVSKNEKDNYYFTSTGKLCVLISNSSICNHFNVKFFKNYEEVEWYPVSSKKLGIFMVNTLLETQDVINIKLLLKKCIVIPQKDNFFVIPLCDSKN